MSERVASGSPRLAAAIRRWLCSKLLEAEPDDGEERSLAFDLPMRSDLLRDVDEMESGSPLSVLVTDIDDFKEFNHRVGHPRGDAQLSAIAERLRSLCPAGASVYRFGGDEFAVVLPGDDGDQLAAIAEELRAAAERDRLVDADDVDLGARQSAATRDGLRHRFARPTLTVAVVALRAPVGRHVWGQLELAISEAKEQGGNRVVVATALDLSQLPPDDGKHSLKEDLPATGP